jgi:hypothetical protein
MHNLPVGADGESAVPVQTELVEVSSLAKQFVGEPAQPFVKALLDATIIDSDVSAGEIFAPSDVVLENEEETVGA